VTYPVNDEAMKLDAPVCRDELQPRTAGRTGTARWARAAMGVALCAALVLASASPAFADRYDKRRAGHPLRIAAYIIYPVGALLDVLIMRPAHWLVNQEPFKSAVGHED
jgi:hypothetical protein